MIDTRTAEAVKADKFLASLLGNTPDFPTENIVGLSENEKIAVEQGKAYGTAENEGIAGLRKITQQPDNILEDPTIKALMAKLNEEGDLSANRLSRGLMTRGQTGGVGADALGRHLDATDRNKVAALAPYATQRRQQNISANEVLGRLGDSSQISRLNALTGTGGLERGLTQLQETANYQKYLRQIMFPYEQQANVARTLSGSQRQDVQMNPSDFEATTGMIKIGGRIAAGVATGGASELAYAAHGARQGGGGGSPYYSSGDIGRTYS